MTEAEWQAKLVEVEKERDELKRLKTEIWLPCDQTIQCAICGWVEWEDDNPHPSSCPLGRYENHMRSEAAKVTTKLEVTEKERDAALKVLDELIPSMKKEFGEVTPDRYSRYGPSIYMRIAVGVVDDAVKTLKASSQQARQEPVNQIQKQEG